MIRRRENGSHYCDGRECGFPLSWRDCDPEEGAGGEWVCPDCWASMYAEKPKHFDGEQGSGGANNPARGLAA